MGDAGGSERTVWRGDEWARVARRHHSVDSGDELTTAVVFALADAEEAPPHEVADTPLYECIDIDALERIVDGRPAVDGSAGTRAVRFEYGGYLVEIQPDGLVAIYEAIGDERS